MKSDKPASIYAIRNKMTGRIYIGSTVDVQVRVQTHFIDLRHGHKRITNRFGDNVSKPSQWQLDFNKYGLDSFEWYILEENIPPDKRAEREEYYIKLYRAAEKEYGYNHRELVGAAYDKHFKTGMPPLPMSEAKTS